MDITNAVKFETLYLQQLGHAVREFPEEYTYTTEQVPAVFERMMAAIHRESFNKDSRAIKATCKILGIKHTYKAIKKYLTTRE